MPSFHHAIDDYYGFLSIVNGVRSYCCPL